MRIFVSSTFEDLTEHRAAAIRVLRQLGHEVVVMEDMVAGDAAPLHKVIEMVDRCEVYVGIFAWRYGFVPPAGGGPGAARVPVAAVPHAVPGQTSITHYEYLRARQRDLPVLAFLLEERAPWPPYLIDGHALGGALVNAQRIRDLRAELQQERVVAWFRTPADLEARVAAAVTMAGLSRQIDLQGAVAVGGGAGAQSVMDSGGGSMAHAVGGADSSQIVFKIDLAEEWWSTRLYLLAALAERLTQVRRVLVLRSELAAASPDKRLAFVGLIPTATIIATMRLMHPQLGSFEAWLLDQTQWPEDRREAVTMAMQAGWAPTFGGVGATPQAAQDAEQQAKHAVTPDALKRWFGDAMLQQPVQISDINRATVVDLIRLVDYPSSCVPVLTRVRVAGREEAVVQIDVVDKVALNARLAQSYLTELKERARLV